jgi:hypothetical protein
VKTAVIQSRMSHFKTPDASAFWEALLPKWVAAQISGRKSFLRGSERAVLNRRTQANTLGENCHAYTIALNNLHDPPDGTGVIRGGCMLEAKSSGPNHRKCLHCCLNDETLLVTPSGSNPRSPQQVRVSQKILHCSACPALRCARARSGQRRLSTVRIS